MTCFVVLAAGRGSRLGRVGDSLHKCLVPLEGRAVLSHQLLLRPPDSRVIICVGYRADQVRSYVELAHPHLDVQFVDVPDWNDPGAGPGASLLAAREAIGDEDLVFTSCDTLWQGQIFDDAGKRSYLAVAPVPPGTTPTRWCRALVDELDRVVGIIDKQPTAPASYSYEYAYTGLARIRRADLQVFWDGVTSGDVVSGELQVSGGFEAILEAHGRIYAQHIDWTDIGDEDAYRAAVAKVSGYDWTKADQSTYVLPDEGVVVKFHADTGVIERRYRRGLALATAGVVPTVRRSWTHDMFGVDYRPGITFYEHLDELPHTGASGAVADLLTWVDRRLRRPATTHPDVLRSLGRDFYFNKTLDRVGRLGAHLRAVAVDVISRVDWDAVIEGVVPSSTWHGDLNFGNLIVDPTGEIVGIDWREDFAGITTWGDARYDVAKLLAGCIVHWDRARRGDFRPWDEGTQFAKIIRDSSLYTYDCEVIGALSLLNSAPLHASPLDEVLVARAVSWLTEVL